MTFSTHPFTLRQIQYAVAIARTGGFRRAADVCGVSQPSLSAQVALLEESLSVRLFERSRRGALVTREGALLLSRFGDLLTAAGDVIDEAAGLADPMSGTLRFGVIPTVAPYLLPGMAETLPPALRIEWTEGKTDELVGELHAGRLDGALLALEADLGPVEHAVVGNDPFVLVMAKDHPLAGGRRRIALEQLHELSVLLLTDGHCLREQALTVCTTNQEGSFRATSLSTLLEMVARGPEVTLLPSLALAVENRRNQLSVRRFRDPVPGRTLGVIWRRGSPREPASRAVARAAKAAMRA